MARLKRGENSKIDRINDLVAIVKYESIPDDSSVIGVSESDAMAELLSMFRPMMIGICDKWCKHFDDTKHRYIPFDELLSDAEYWFIKYTVEKYIIDGDATFNKFIKDHINQRIRYIYECQLKYYNQTIFPDPIRHQDDNQDGDQLDMVIFNYSSQVSGQQTIEEKLCDEDMANKRYNLARRIIKMVEDSNNFNEREKEIFRETMINGVSQNEMSDRLGISRTRIVQILRKIRYKLKIEMENDAEFWELITQTDIIFDNNCL